jgi:D-alanyl-D-alanine endopeptidase (penicillin-binding protein 7)
MRFGNTNLLVRNTRWDIGLSKTGYLSEAGRCLVMQATLAGRSVIIVLLDSWGKYTRVADAMRIRQWLEFAIGRSGMQRPALSPITNNERGLAPAQAVRARTGVAARQA